MLICWGLWRTIGSEVGCLFQVVVASGSFLEGFFFLFEKRKLDLRSVSVWACAFRARDNNMHATCMHMDYMHAHAHTHAYPPVVQ